MWDLTEGTDGKATCKLYDREISSLSSALINLLLYAITYDVMTGHIMTLPHQTHNDPQRSKLCVWPCSKVTKKWGTRAVKPWNMKALGSHRAIQPLECHAVSLLSLGLRGQPALGQEEEKPARLSPAPASPEFCISQSVSWC